MQEFPFGTSVAGRLDRLEKTLHATFGIHETAALLDVRAARQKIVRQCRRFARAECRNNQVIEFAE